jgi:hypothetical protein
VTWWALIVAATWAARIAVAIALVCTVAVAWKVARVVLAASRLPYRSRRSRSYAPDSQESSTGHERSLARKLAEEGRSPQ